MRPSELPGLLYAGFYQFTLNVDADNTSTISSLLPGTPKPSRGVYGALEVFSASKGAGA